MCLDMASAKALRKSTPETILSGQPHYNYSVKYPQKKKNQNNEISEEKDISLRDIYEIINALKVDIQDSMIYWRKECRP